MALMSASLHMVRLVRDWICLGLKYATMFILESELDGD